MMKFSKTLTVAFILIGCICVFGQKTDGKLKVGTYGVQANELTVIKSSGITMDLDTRVDIKILSVDNQGNVRAEVSRYGKKNQFNGKIDSSGNLYLEVIS